jgi:hypothetical protein
MFTVNFNEFLGFDPEFLYSQVSWLDFDDAQGPIDESVMKSLKELIVKYFVYGYEVGDTMNLHIQGYSEFIGGMRYETIRNVFAVNRLPLPHLEPRRGTREEVIEYYKKDGMFHELERVFEGKEGSRRLAVELVQKHGFPWVVRNDLYAAHLLNKATCMMHDDLKIGPDRSNDPPIEFVWWFGEPGAGKTFLATQWVSSNGTEEYAFKMAGMVFFVLFTPTTKNVLLDNITLSTEQEMKDILGFGDRNPYIAQVKGSYVHNVKFACTSVFSPRDLFETMPPALQRGHTWNEIRRWIIRLFRVVERVAEPVDVDTMTLVHLNTDLNMVV